MLFYTVNDAATGDAVGILLEGDAGGVVAVAFLGSDDSDSPLRVIQKIMESESLSVVRRRNEDTVALTVRNGEPGYCSAVVSTVRPPLLPGVQGRVKQMGSPSDMVRRVWLAIGAAGVPPLLAGFNGSPTDVRYPHRHVQ